ncbi:pyridoxal phosphate-dependent aminotransferase [Streptomyces sp. RLB3-17]|uniref:aminotransferase class I/II-fold pyridoxal phosphate-dependent enzyme n=1 Tax=unclassified Streptomyces TaxID=2593676 RepID=UPI001163F025|nr:MULTISPECIES: pyridoxal phosphate-dependent aminotransferase [unclassified Streptomyces]NMI62398.1 pyridoxal phosphate-dependent aminotransferase [Streptomyces sp. RLA2-12]QDN61402.1 pyridoxal phosphate-dependent aminotransferase [Streptomyces sp. S1D4-20]QDN71455.1 pyridoxal phosphate-dependent aminotransferase [Streptomyces sp. S1D4-14]QDO43996.1 pyridoxal phosphate-dependent aminotransferase [Streptomyces sp. RLB3-17]QDO53911.1 pyridoxal phosphate-dependent aminotransferase [Streptomyces
MTTSAKEHLLAKQDRSHRAINSFIRARDAISAADDQEGGGGWMNPDVISLAHGEGVRRPHHSVVAAGVRALLDTTESSLDNYLYLRRFPAFEEELTATFRAAGIPDDAASNLCIDSGNTRLFLAFFHAVGDPGDVFLVPQGYYQAVNMWADISSVYLETVETRRSNDYKFTRGDLEEFYRRRVDTGEVRRPKGLILFSPSYTGAVYEESELAEIAEFVEQRDLVVLEDAIFRGTEFTGRSSAHLAGMPKMSQRVVTINGGSKAYGLANIRIGWGCGPQYLIERMNYYTMATSITVPHIAKAMALAALRAPAEYLEGNIAECAARAELVARLLDEINENVASALGFTPAEPLLTVAHDPKAAHSVLVSGNGMAGLLTPDGREITDSTDVTRHFLNTARVCLSPGVSNGFTDCTVRIAFGCLGWEHTYAYPKHAEIVAGAGALLTAFDPGLSDRAVAERLHAAGIDPQWSSLDQLNPGFQGGREELTEAIQRRLGPAVVRLALDNQQELRARHARSAAAPEDTAVLSAAGSVPELAQ